MALVSVNSKNIPVLLGATALLVALLSAGCSKSETPAPSSPPPGAPPAASAPSATASVPAPAERPAMKDE